MPATALADQLAAKGFTARTVRFNLAIAEFQNNGGTFDEAADLVVAAYDAADKYTQAAQTLNERRWPKNAAKGRIRISEEGNHGMPDAAPQRSADRTPIADKAAVEVSVASPKMPGHAKRGAVEIAAVQQAVARSLFDTTMLPDGRRLREIRWSECPNLAGRYRKLSRVLMAVHNVGVPADPNSTLDNLVTEEGLADILQAVERFNDIH